MSDKGAVHFPPSWSPQALAGLSKAVIEMNKPYRDQRQIDVAQRLFEWWWVRSNDGLYNPRWESCLDTIQAFWMDGAHRVLSGMPLITVTEPRGSRIAQRSDRRAPYKQLLGWATARALESVAYQKGKSVAWSMRLKYERDENHPFPIFTEDPE